MTVQIMEDGVNTENSVTMGATGNPNITRFATLQERKKSIEELLLKYNQELKQICLQEADLTGVIPQEMPLEPGELPPQIRRRVGTAYQLPENLVKNSSNKDETVRELELQVQVHAHMAEAALDLANENNVSKTLRRKHMADYQQHKRQYNSLQEQLGEMKEKALLNEQMKKKKPRPPDQDDNVSVRTNMNEPFVKSDLRHSIRSSKYGDDERYQSNPRMVYKNSYVDPSYSRQEESLSRGVYALSINGYRNYMEIRENMSRNHIPNYNTLQYQQYPQHSSVNPHFPPQQPYQSRYNYPQTYQLVKNSHSPTAHTNLRIPHRQSSPNVNTPNAYKTFDYPNYRYSESENVHQIQPHQQYEQMNSGLGGYWKRLDNDELVWCNSSPVESNWQRDKRFGSLDRRKNKRMHKRVSPSVSNKSATLPYHDHVRMTAVKSPQIVNRRSQDSRQLVRTQSLGSVGGQTIDSAWHSDDNSSEGDNRSMSEAAQNARKQKPKEWVETSLDGPVSPTHSIVSRSQSALPSVLSPEEKYIPQIPPKPPLEIPAESNPSPRIPETNIELFNNNIPKHCTLVQAGHFKPYHEETKPFEMADWYKYSTKFKKSPVKQQEEMKRSGFQKNLNEAFEKNHNFKPGSPRAETSSLNSSFDISQNVAERFSDEMNAWYTHNLQVDAGSPGSKPKTTATLV